MSWKKWLPKYDVPKTIERLVDAKVLKDKTHSGDAVPHFEAALADGSTLVLWVDHPDVSWRALPNGPRYGIEIYRHGKLPETVFESNMLDDTILALREILEERGRLRLL